MGVGNEMNKSPIFAAVCAIALTFASPALLTAQGTPNVADANLLTEAFLIPETNLVIDVPMVWSELPPEMFGPSMFEGWFGSDADEYDMIASFGGSAPNQSGFGVMIISDAEPFTRPPLAEMQILEKGVKLSRIATWIIGSGMAVVRPSREIEIEDGTGATMSFLSGPEDAHDIVTLTIIKREEDSLMIVDIARKDSEEAVILDQMRASLRPQ